MSETIDRIMRDFYPRAGERIKQYVLDTAALDAWETETCPRIDVPAHLDSHGGLCWVGASALWLDLSRAPWCQVCRGLSDKTADWPEVVAWGARTDRPLVTEDHELLSGLVAPVLCAKDDPVVAFVAKRSHAGAEE